RFETARAFCVACRSKRKQPGTTLAGFENALARLPLAVLRTLAVGVRQQILRHLGGRLLTDGFFILGCDGTRLETPRSAELEERLPKANKTAAAPTVYVTALVHVATGLLWAWQIGLGTASEHFHLLTLLRTVPSTTLVVADANFVGYNLFNTIMNQQLHFLVRASSYVYCYTDRHVRLERFREGLVWYWPAWAQRQKLLPLRLRLICIRGPKVKVWLLTNVLDPARLSHAAASQIYRWRWQNEGFFRTYKRTASKCKLRSRTVALIHREVEGSLLAVQLLLAHGTAALPTQPRSLVLRPSPRQVLCAVRQDLQHQIATHLGRRQQQTYRQRLQQVQRDERRRQGDKTRRHWPRRRPQRVPAAPILHMMPPKVKALKQRLGIAA